MPQEIEIKLKVASHEPIRGRLGELQARSLGTTRETNIFFDRPDGSLRRADSGLRVRLNRDDPQALLTFKGPAAATGLHAREAFDLQVSPRDQVMPLLKSLGFVQLFLFEKDRESWELDGCKVELDVVPHFGLFVEIEGLSEAAVIGLQLRLQLEAATRENKSYSHLVSEHLQGWVIKELRF